MAFQIKQRKMSEQVLEQIKTLIKDGTFKANTKLPSEIELTKMFQVSRSPVREAISVLAANGIVESRQGGGNWVRNVDFASMLGQATLEMVDTKQINQLLEFRMIIETEAAVLAAERYRKEDLEALKETLNVLEINMLNDQSINDRDADYNFHTSIARASHNPFLVQTIDNIFVLYQKTMRFTPKRNVGIMLNRELLHEQHTAIFGSIRDRDSEEAAKNMKAHLQMAMPKTRSKINREQRKINEN